MIETRITIINKLGLHARAAAKLVSTSSAFGCDVRASCNGRTVDAKSIMAVMMLAAGRGTELQLRCDGEDEEQALQALVDLINGRFGESE